MPLKLYRRGKIWHFRGTVGPPERRSRLRGSCKTSDKPTAARQISEIENRYWKGHFDGPEAVLTFEEAARIYLAAGKSGRFLEPVREYLKGMFVKDIKPSTINQMAMELFGHCSGASRNRLALVPAQAVINYCADSELCQPLRIKDRFKEETKVKDIATLDWVQAFQVEAAPLLGAYALFMFLTGARPTEGLLVDPEQDLNLQERKALIRQTKIGKEREPHLPPLLVATLANLPRVKGRPLFGYQILGDLRHAWEDAIQRAGIKRLTPHCCRHGFVTELLRRKIDVVTIGWLADMSPERVMNTYGHAIMDRTQTNVLTDTKLTRAFDDITENTIKTGTF